MQVRRDKAAVGTVTRKEEVKGEMDRTSSVDSYDTESEREREEEGEAEKSEWHEPVPAIFRKGSAR